MNHSEYLEGKDFSIVLGGPFFQLLSRVHLTGKSLEWAKLRTVIISLIAWLPLLILSILNGQAWGAKSSLPFLQDFDVQLRFLVAMPLLIIAEVIVHQRMQAVVKQFQQRDLVPEDSIKTQFHKAINSALQLRNSFVAEAIMVAIIYGIGYQVVWRQSAGLETSTWYSEGKGTLSWAGIWFRFVSLPLFQFLFIRWYYRIFIWSRFLFQVSRIPLKLVPSHPDNVGGLGFLSGSISAIMPLALAHGVLLAGLISNHIFYESAKLMDFKIEVLVIVFLVLGLAIVPLLVFSPQLAERKRHGSLEYGELASHFVRDFETKWIAGSTPVDRHEEGGDVQSLADLSNLYKVVESMQVLPVTRNAIVQLVIATVAPVLPLLLTMMPIGELIKTLAGILL